MRYGFEVKGAVGEEQKLVGGGINAMVEGDRLSWGGEGVGMIGWGFEVGSG